MLRAIRRHALKVSYDNIWYDAWTTITTANERRQGWIEAAGDLASDFESFPDA